MGNQHINIVIFQHEKVLPHNSLEIPSSPNRTFQDNWCGHGATTVWLPSSPNIILSGNFEISALLRNNTHLSLSCLHFLSSAPSSDTVKLCKISFPPFPPCCNALWRLCEQSRKRGSLNTGDLLHPWVQLKSVSCWTRFTVSKALWCKTVSSVPVSQMLNTFHSERSVVA